MGRLGRKHRGKGNFCSQGINRGKHLVDLNKEKQAHVSFFNFLFFRATKQPHYEPAVNVLSKVKGKSWWGRRGVGVAGRARKN